MALNDGIVKVGQLQYCIARDLKDDCDTCETPADSMRGAPWETYTFTLHENGVLVKENDDDNEEILLKDQPLLKIFGRDWFDDQDLTILNLGWSAAESHRQFSFCLQSPHGVRRYFCPPRRENASQEDLEREIGEWTNVVSKSTVEKRPTLKKRSTFTQELNVSVVFCANFIKAKRAAVTGCWGERFITICNDGYMRYHNKKGESPYKIWHIPSIVQRCRKGGQISELVDKPPAVKNLGNLVALDILNDKGKQRTYYFYPYKCDANTTAMKFSSTIKRLIRQFDEEDIRLLPIDVYVMEDGYPSDLGLNSRILPYEMQIVLNVHLKKMDRAFANYFTVLSDDSKHGIKDGVLRTRANNGSFQDIKVKTTYFTQTKPSPGEIHAACRDWPTSRLLKVNEPSVQFNSSMQKTNFISENATLPFILDSNPDKTRQCIAERQKAADEKRRKEEEERRKDEASFQIRRHDWSAEKKPVFRDYHQPEPVSRVAAKSPKGGGNAFMKEQSKMMQQQQKFIEKQQKRMFKDYQKNMEEQIVENIDFAIQPNIEIPGVQECFGGAYILEGCM